MSKQRLLQTEEDRSTREVMDRPAPLKIREMEFWPPVLPAPMCGISDRPWRMFAREKGCPLVYTQMVSSEAMVRENVDHCWDVLDMQLEPGPVCAQLFGADPDHLAESARRLQDEGGATIVDLNMGCPVKKIVRNNGGSALMKSPDLVREIFRKMRAQLTIPFTVKFRAGWEKFGEEAFVVARIAQEEGLDAVAIHARTREQGYEGAADWSIIQALKKEITIPVIGNGDVNSANDAVRMMRDFGADAVMIGRGCMGNPWLFREIVARFKGEPDPAPPSVDELLDTVLLHADLMVMRKDERLGLREFRKHVVSYMKNFPYAKELKKDLLNATTLKEYHDIIERRRPDVRDWAFRDAHPEVDWSAPDALHGSCADC